MASPEPGRDFPRVKRVHLIEARNRLGLSRMELGRQLGLDRTYIFRVEEGHRRPSLQIMVRWARRLNVSMDLFRDDNQPFAA
jgi:transcriptional regulator with XRE-family HTH domain